MAQWLNFSMIEAGKTDLNRILPNKLPKERKELFCINFQIIQFSLWAIRHFVEDIGVEPMTLCVQGRCSSQLS